MEVPLSRPSITEKEVQAVLEVLSTPYLSLGPRLKEFEARFAEYLGSRHAVAVSSGTAGLHAAVRALGIGQGDEVITTPFSFVASANCLLFEGARPVFVDIDADTLNIDPRKIEERITPATKALLIVHIFGRPCPMEEVMAIAGRQELPVIEDACEALGARAGGKALGTIGKVGVFGFYPNKQLTTGEGGMVVTDDPELAALLMSLRNQGREERGWLAHYRLGYNYRLDELSCALGLAQLSRLEEILAKRQAAARRYNLSLAECRALGLPSPGEEEGVSWFVYVVRLPEGVEKETIKSELAQRGIATGDYFPPIHLQPLYRERFGYEPGAFPVTEAVAATTLALPFFTDIGENQQDYICENLLSILREYGY
ncbi:MAG: DegT/DnrJ/EryC1/StrS family aminotransferase [Nitrospinota bacterium]